MLLRRDGPYCQRDRIRAQALPWSSPCANSEFHTGFAARLIREDVLPLAWTDSAPRPQHRNADTSSTSRDGDADAEHRPVADLEEHGSGEFVAEFSRRAVDCFGRH